MPNATFGTLKDRTLTSLQVIGGVGSTNSNTGSLTVRGGIGVSENLNVGGNVLISGTLEIPGNVEVGLLSIGGESEPNYVLTATDTSGNTSWRPNWIGISGKLHYNDNISIGTTETTELLTIRGNAYLDGILKVPDTLDIYGNISIKGYIQDEFGTYYLPGVSDILTGISATQTLSNKTLITPTISGNMNFNSTGRIINLNPPINDGDATNKSYVDALINGLDWQESVISKSVAIPPGSPTLGDRYIIPVGATGVWSTHINKITEWNGSSWNYIIPNEGYASLVEDLDKQYNYNGSAWVLFGSLVNHSSLVGLTNDEHLQYALLSGRSGGQQWYGGTNASDKLIIESTLNSTKGSISLQPTGGNVGIGITNALFQFHVSENDANAQQVSVEQNNTSGQAGIRIHHKSDIATGYNIQQTNTGQVNITQTSTTGHVSYYNKGTSSDYRFYNTNADIERFTIKTDGTIQISGNQSFTGTTNKILFSNELLINSNSTDLIYIGATGNFGLGISATNQLQTTKSAHIGENLYIGTTGAGLKDNLDLFSNTNLTFRTSDIQRMIIGATGNVGINSSSPQDRLDITGNIRVSGTINQAAKVFTLPATTTDTLVARTSTDTLTNKTLVDNSTLIVDDGDASKALEFSLAGATSGRKLILISNHSNNRSITFPDITDTLVSLTAAQTLTNKTLTTPVISSIVNSGTLTLPGATDTLVARNTVDTLTNKTLASPNITGNLSMADLTYVSTDQVRARDADGLLLTDDGNSGIFIQDGGNVGIGSLTPSSKLDVSGDAKFNNNALFVKQSSNYVGINTTTPSTNLDVNGSVYISNNLTINGNLEVNGTITNVNSSVVTIDDPLFELANNNSGNIVDIGFYGMYIEGGVTKYTGFFRDVSDAAQPFKLFKGLQQIPSTIINTSGTGYDKGDLYLGDMEADFITIGTFASTYPLLINKTVSSNWSQRITNNLTNIYLGHSDGLGININTSSVSDTSYIALFGNTTYSQAFRVQNNGLVGIRTSSPSEILDVYGTSVGDGARIGNAKIGVWEGSVNYAAFTHDTVHATSTSYALKQLNTGETYLNTAATKSLHFRNNDVDTMIVDENGNVGIGTLTPQKKLHVQGGTLVTLDLDVYGDLNIFGQINAVAAESIVVQDPMFKLAHDNTLDILDTGFYMQYGISNGATEGIRYAGIIRDNDDDMFKIFHNLQVEPGTTQVTTTDPSFHYAAFGVGQLNIFPGTTKGELNLNYGSGSTGAINFYQNDILDHRFIGVDDTLYIDTGNQVVFRKLADESVLFTVDQVGLNVEGDFTSNTLGVTTTLTNYGNTFLNGDLTVASNTLFIHGVSGRVGIGTNSPGFKLHVVGDIGLHHTDGNLAGYIMTTAEAATTNKVHIVGSRGQGGIVFSTNNGTTIGERMRINATGYVGIGTTNVDSLFHLAYTSGSTISASPTSQGIRMGFNGSGRPAIEFSGSTDAIIDFNLGNGSDTLGRIAYSMASDIMSFRTNSTDRLVILSNGNVGIGINAPDNKLHIRDTTAQTNVDASDFLPSSFTHDLILERQQSSTLDAIYGRQGPALEFRSNNGTNVWSCGSIVGLIDPFGGSTYDGGLAFYTSPGGSVNHNDLRDVGGLLAPAFALGHDRRAYFNGNVGIGTTNPSSKLEINGNCTATQFITLSDVQAKENIRELSSDKCIETLKNINVYEFDYKETNHSSVGVLAQEVEAMFPEAVVNQNGTKYVNYQMLFVLMMGCIKNLINK